MNKSKYDIDTRLCKECGKCCSSFEFFIGDIKGLGDRLRFLDTDLIEVKDAGCYPDGTKRISIRFYIPCKHLKKVDGKYKCKIYFNPKKPQLCSEYPYSIRAWERENCLAIQKKMQEEGE